MTNEFIKAGVLVIAMQCLACRCNKETSDDPGLHGATVVPGNEVGGIPDDSDSDLDLGTEGPQEGTFEDPNGADEQMEMMENEPPLQGSGDEPNPNNPNNSNNPTNSNGQNNPNNPNAAPQSSGSDLNSNPNRP